MSKLTVDNIFSDAELDYTCPACSKLFKFKMNQVQEDNSKVVCEYCNTEITFVQTEETKHGKQELQNALDSVMKALDDLGK